MQSNFYIAQMAKQMAHHDVKLTTIDAMTKIYTKMRNNSKQLLNHTRVTSKERKRALLADRVYVYVNLLTTAEHMLLRYIVVVNDLDTYVADIGLRWVIW